MNQKQLLALLAALVVVGGLGLVVYKQSNSSWESGPGKLAGTKILGEFPLNDVTQVTIKTSGTNLTLSKKDDTWVVTDRDDYPAEFSKVQNLIQGFWDLKAVQGVPVGPSQYGRMELVAPAKGAADTGTLVELLNKDSKPVASLLLGKKYNKKSEGGGGMPGMEGGYPAGRYVMPTAGVNASKVSLISDTLEQAEPKPEDWLNKKFLKIDRIQSVTVTGTDPQVHYSLSRATDEGTDWKLDGIKPDEKVDTAKVPSFAGTFGSPYFSDVLPRDAKLGDKVSTITLQTFDNFTFTLKVGAPQNENYPVSVLVAGDFPKERTPGKDEKPDDKKKLDGEFATKTKMLKEILVAEKKFEARIYLISKSTLDSVFKKRSELLEEKKASPTPSPAPVTTPAAAPAAAPVPAPAPAASAKPASPVPVQAPVRPANTPPFVQPARTPVSVTTPPLSLEDAKAAEKDGKDKKPAPTAKPEAKNN